MTVVTRFVANSRQAALVLRCKAFLWLPVIVIDDSNGSTTVLSRSETR
jgi:hypothetical protein